MCLVSQRCIAEEEAAAQARTDAETAAARGRALVEQRDEAVLKVAEKATGIGKSGLD